MFVSAVRSSNVLHLTWHMKAIPYSWYSPRTNTHNIRFDVMHKDISVFLIWCVFHVTPPPYQVGYLNMFYTSMYVYKVCTGDWMGSLFDVQQLTQWRLARDIEVLRWRSSRSSWRNEDWRGISKHWDEDPLAAADAMDIREGYRSTEMKILSQQLT
jgi:hypothetical protein